MTDVAPVSAESPAALSDAEIADAESKGAIVVRAKPKKPFNVVLIGHPYRALPVKMMGAVGMGKKLKAAGSDTDKVMFELQEWLTSVFGKTQTPGIMARLEDPADDLDLDDIMDLIRTMIQRKTGNPTS